MLVILFLVFACADTAMIDPCLADEAYTAGFWSGLWHGIVTPVSFFGSLLDSDIAVYAVDNNGGWYDFGFVIGIGAFFGGGASSKR